MPRRRKRRPNWPYRYTWLAILGAVVLYLVVQTIAVSLGSGKRMYGTDWLLSLVSACLDATVAVWFVTVGASIGSFLNVVAYRLPLGRYIGGHSGCPYCQTLIESRDNVPVLGWVNLRGRCRTCRLPISVQYPLVELTVALVFLVIFISEFSRGGGNLLGSKSFVAFGGIMRLSVTPELIIRIIVYLLVISGLIAAALIAVRRKSAPLVLFAFAGLPLLVAGLIRPSVIIIPWRARIPEGFVGMRLDVIATLLCGAAAGMAIARLIAPVLYRSFDPRLLARDAATTGARQFIAAMGLVGSLLGWQSVVSFTWVLLLSSLAAVLCLRRFRPVAHLADLTVWIWLGLLVFRAGWKSFYSVTIFPSVMPEVMSHLAGALLLAPLVILFRNLASPPAEEPPELTPAVSNDEDTA